MYADTSHRGLLDSMAAAIIYAMKLEKLSAFFLTSAMFVGTPAYSDAPSKILRNGDFSTELDKSLQGHKAATEHLKNASAFSQRKIYAQAIAEYDQAAVIAEQEPDNPLSLSRETLCQAHAGKGDAYMSMKDYKSAVASYSEACRLKPKYSSFVYGRAQIGIGEANFQLARFEDAASAYSKSLSNSDGMSLYGLHYGEASRADQFFRTGEPEKAAKMFHKAFLANERDRNRPLRFYSGDDTESKLDDMQRQIDFLKWHR